MKTGQIVVHKRNKATRRPYIMFRTKLRLVKHADDMRKLNSFFFFLEK